MPLYAFSIILLMLSAACPRPIEQQSMPPKTEPSSYVPLSQKRPPPLPPNLKKFQDKMRGKRKLNKALGLDFNREEKLRQRREVADMLLLTAEKELAEGRIQAAQKLCIQAQAKGAGIPEIGYRPQVCLQSISASQNDWEVVSKRYLAKQGLKEKWAAVAQWKLLGARAYFHQGQFSKAKALLEGIKKNAEVASEAEGLLKKMKEQ